MLWDVLILRQTGCWCLMCGKWKWQKEVATNLNGSSFHHKSRHSFTKFFKESDLWPQWVEKAGRRTETLGGVGFRRRRRLSASAEPWQMVMLSGRGIWVTTAGEYFANHISSASFNYAINGVQCGFGELLHICVTLKNRSFWPQLFPNWTVCVCVCVYSQTASQPIYCC